MGNEKEGKPGFGGRIKKTGGKRAPAFFQKSSTARKEGETGRSVMKKKQQTQKMPLCVTVGKLQIN